ncbi:hypothetical protein PsYK624_032280 [Phanerochaete sordida]|uniref:Uncharacterized protein n=1 Tax=Phanerochaete sordida TaxID=48140 RepID=A0A9P3L9H5_9APHY|nr:hypothetical protein PsYK624_032280 [Phanerochaete sordida]
MSRRSTVDRESPRPSRQVNTLLHTLRGEQFRHQQNLTRTSTHITTFLQNKPTLPLAQIFGTGGSSSTADDAYADPLAPVQPAPFREPGAPGHRRGMRPPVTLVEGVPTYAYPNGAVPGPRPPRSWTSLFDEDERHGQAWRARALRLLFDDLRVPRWVHDVEVEDEDVRTIPPLSLECARMLLEMYRDSEDWAEVASYIPTYVKRDLVRWYAVRRPLGNATLYALYGDEAHAGGELLVVGPEASLKRSALVKGMSSHHHPHSVHATEGERTSHEDVDSWDTPGDPATPLAVLVLIATSLPNELVTSLAPTITHLSLIALPQPARVYRLPEVCPLLEVLDLSYNDWLSGASITAEGSLERVPWRRWRYLRILGLRECGVGTDIAQKVNTERWTDVDIVGLDRPVLTKTSQNET